MKTYIYIALTAAIIITGCQQQQQQPVESQQADQWTSTTTESDRSVDSAAEPVESETAEHAAGSTDGSHEGHAMSERGPGMGRGHGGMGRGRGAMGGMREDMATLYAMFADRDKIKRTVRNLPDGAEAITESDDETIAALLQEHVPAMEGRVVENKPLPPMTFHPIFVELIRHADDYSLQYEETDKGMKVSYHADDPFVVMLVQEHAKLVSRFIKNGMEEIHKPYTLPNLKNDDEAKTVPAKAATVAENEVTDEWRALPKEAPSPADNPTTAAKVELGKKLFFDPRLSLTGTVSCNSCHNLMEGGDDGRPSSMGVHGRIGPRNAPTVWNSAFQASQFWDGRSPSLEDQAMGPIVAAPEMGMPDHDKAIGRIAAIPGYRAELHDVFGGESPVTIENVVRAIAAFERTLVTPNSPYDRFVQGDKSAISKEQIRGMKLFANVGCTECHSGPAFNGWEAGSARPTFAEFPRNRSSRFVKQYGLNQDRGRGDVTKDEADNHLFKVPTLRNITITGPYLHNGAVPTLAETVRIMADTELDTELSDAEVSDIVAFLAALEGHFPEIAMPRLPSRSGKSILENQEPAAASGH